MTRSRARPLMDQHTVNEHILLTPDSPGFMGTVPGGPGSSPDGSNIKV